MTRQEVTLPTREVEFARRRIIETRSKHAREMDKLQAQLNAAIEDTTTHELKIAPVYFRAVADGIKTFELRKEDDRRFEEFDTITLREYDTSNCPYPDTGIIGYTGDKAIVRVRYVLRGGFGLEPGWACLAIELLGVTP